MADTNMPTPAAAGNTLTVTPIEGEPRIRDIDLAKRLGFDRPRNIRNLIARHQLALDALGPRSTVKRGINGGEATEFYLNRKQAIFITAKSDTANATEITIEIIEKFDAYERGAIGVQVDPMDLVPLDERRAAVAEVMLCMRLFGPGAARDLWKRSCLPAVEDALVDVPGVARKVMRDDGPACLAHLRAARTSTGETIGEMIDHAVVAPEAAAALRRMGVLVNPRPLPGWVVIADRHDTLERIFRDTPWAGARWRDALHTIAGARRTKQTMRFDSRYRSRAVMLRTEDVRHHQSAVPDRADAAE